MYDGYGLGHWYLTFPGSPRLSSLSAPLSRRYASMGQAPSPNSTGSTQISLHIAASSSGKGRKFKADLSTYDFDPEAKGALGLQEGATLRQIRSGRPDSGQDAYFVAKIGNNDHHTAFGIADGVGGWTSHGVDPADFSHGLCGYMAEAALEWKSGKLGPIELLQSGYQKTVEDPKIKAGGSTACIAVAEDDGRMHIANLGDSGFLLLRRGTVHHYSNPQTHAFNTPYQMSITPPDILRQAAIFGGMPLNDHPERADVADHMLRHGDVLVLATDGVWDNLDAQEVLHIVTQQMTANGAWEKNPQQGFVVHDKITRRVRTSTNDHRSLQSRIASSIVGEAKSASLNQKRDGPFAKAWAKEEPLDPYHGGKVDDITVLVIISVDHTKSSEHLNAKL